MIFFCFVLFRTEIKSKAAGTNLLRKISVATISGVNQTVTRTNKSSQNNGSERQRQHSLDLTAASDVTKAPSCVRSDVSSVSTEKNILTTLNASTKMGSPVPCGESFFEEDAILTQTHVDFMSKFKRHSLNGNSPLSTVSPLTSTKVCASTPYASNRASAGNSGFTDLNNSSFLDSCTNNKQESQSCSYIIPNKQNVVKNHVEEDEDIFDDVDDEMNLQMAEEFDFDDEPSVVTGPSKITNQSKEWNTSSVFKGNNSSYPQEMSRDEFIEEFDEDEDFNEILQEENIPLSSRLSLSKCR